MLYTRSIVTPFETATADSIDTKDLPVNPISFLLLHLKFASKTADTKATLANVLATLDRLSVIFKGNNVISLSGEDLFAYAYIMWRRFFHQVNEINLIAAVRSVTLPIPFAKRPFDPAMAFPATSRGNLIIELDWASSFTNLETLTYSIEAVELPEATPATFLRCVPSTLSGQAVGDVDLQLPIGNPLLAVILFGTTIPTEAVATRTINSVQLLVDNQQRYVSKIDFESVHNALGLRVLPPIWYDDHYHLPTDATDTGPAERKDDLLAQYGLIDLDPSDDGQYALDTAGLADLKLRIAAGDDQEIRVLPVELFTVGI